MGTTRIAKKPLAHSTTDGLTRNAGVRPTDDIDEAALIDRKLLRVRLEGVSHPVSNVAPTLVLPGTDSVHRMAIARNGQINELAVWCDQIIDGPAYLRVYDQDGPVKDQNDQPVQIDLKSDDWATATLFEVTKGQRLKFVLDNVKVWPGNVRPEDIPALTGSDNLSIIGAWLTCMYFAEGGNRGSGQESTRALPEGP